MLCANEWMYAGRLAEVAGPLGARDHDRERAVGLEAVVEEAQRLGDPARVQVLLAGQLLVAHRRAGLRFACLRNASATFARWSRV